MKKTHFDEEYLLKLKNELAKEDFKIRKNCLEELRVKVQDERICPELDTAFSLFKLLVAVFNDKVESCREKALRLALLCFESWSLPEEQSVFLLLPSICKKLGCGEYTETSEEIRLLLIRVLKVCIQNYGEGVSPFVIDIVSVLNGCLVDRCPDVVRESCDCASILSKTVPDFRLHSEKIMQSVISVLKHKHYRVRVAAINTLEPLILFGRSRSIELVCGALGECLLDQNPHVRRAVYRVASSWFMELRDRYSYFHYMLPLILTGLHDENEEFREETITLWHKIGLQYLKENEEHLKDKHELLPANLRNYPIGVERPNLGCRTLVSREMCKIIPTLLKELEDWRPEVRIKSSELLEVIVLHAEVDIVSYLESMIPVLCKVCSQQEATVLSGVIKSTEMMGFFIEPKIYWPLILFKMKESISFGHYVVVASLFKNNSKNEIYSQLGRIISAMLENGFCETRDPIALEYLLKIISKLIDCCEESPIDDKILNDLYLAVASVMAFGNDDIQSKAANSIQKLACIIPLSVRDLNEKCLPSLFERLLDTCDLWESYSLNLNILLSLLSGFSDDVFELVFDKLLEILKAILRSDGDREIIFKTLHILATVLNRENSKLRNIKYFEKIILGPLKEQLIWKAGKVAEVIRATALSIVVLFLKQNGSISPEFLLDVVPLVLSLCEDGYEETRIYSLEILSYIGLYGGRNVDVYLFKQILIVVAGRLEDKLDEVRLRAAQTLKNVLSDAPRLESYKDTSDFEAIQKALQLLFINVDDNNEKIQKAILELFKEPQIVRNIKLVFSEEILLSFIGKCRYKNVSSMLETYLKIQ